MSAQSEVRVSDEAKRADVEKALEALTTRLDRAAMKAAWMEQNGATNENADLCAEVIEARRELAVLRSAVGAPRGQTEPERVTFRDLSGVDREGVVIATIPRGHQEYEAAVVEFEACFVAHDGADEVWDGSALVIARRYLRASPQQQRDTAK